MSVTLQARRPTPLWVSLTLIAAVAWPYWVWLHRLCASLHYNDFGKFYFGIVAWQEGRSLYALTPASFAGAGTEPLLNLNPPHAMLVVWPFAMLPLDIAYGVWMIVNGACLAWAMTVVCRATAWRPTFWQLVVLLAGAPTATWLVTGQLSGLLAVPLLLAWRAWRTGKMRAAGAWLGFAVSVKPFLGLFVLWMLWRREWPGVAAAAVSGAVMFASGLAVFGIQSHIDWLASIGAVSWPWRAMNASILGIVTRAFTETPGLSPIAVAPVLVKPVWLIASAGVLALLVRRLRAATFDDGWGLVMLATLLVSPLGWTYYLWWSFGGLRAVTSGVPSALFLLPLPVVGLAVFPSAPPWLALIVGSAYGWALLASFAAAPWPSKRLDR